MVRKVHAFILFILINVTMVAQTSTANDFFELKGTVQNGNRKKIYLSYMASKKEVRDSTTIVNNQFIFKGHISCPTRVSLETEKAQFDMTSLNSISIYLEPKKMTTMFDYNDLKTLVLKGSKTHSECKPYIEFTKDINNQINSVVESISVYNTELKKNIDAIKRKDIEAKINDLNEILDKLKIKRANLKLEYAKKNPSSFVSLFILEYPLKLREVSYYEVNTIYNQLSPKVKESESGIEFLQYLEKYKNSIIGSLAPDFTVEDINDKQLVLSSFRNNKYVLIDFWASWCSPCRADLPSLKTFYEKYSEKGFEIISISRDEKLDSWHKVIAKEDISKWKHFSIVKNQSTVEDTYSVTGIPVKILIDKDGKIIGRWKGFSEKNQKELLEKLEQIFDN